jgi:hypothetical protein
VGPQYVEGCAEKIRAAHLPTLLSMNYPELIEYRLKQSKLIKILDALFEEERNKNLISEPSELFLSQLLK